MGAPSYIPAACWPFGLLPQAGAGSEIIRSALERCERKRYRTGAKQQPRVTYELLAVYVSIYRRSVARTRPRGTQVVSLC